MAVNTFKEDEYQKEVLKKDTLVRLYRYLLVYKKQITAVLFIMAVTITISLINPLIIEHAVNVNIVNQDMDGLIQLGVLAVVLNVIYIIGVKMRMVIMAKVSNQVLLTIRNELYIHIQNLSFRFIDSRPTV